MAKLSLIAVPAKPFGFPGHCVVGDGLTYFGFRFEPSELPPEFRPMNRWRRFLNSNKAPGFVFDETSFVVSLLEFRNESRWEKNAETDASVLEVIPDEAEWFDIADYSFNPERFSGNPRPCHNCVTWAIETANAVMPGFLQPVPDGRISKLIDQLQIVIGDDT